ncbi:MAG: hypothetical protein NC240_09190 [Clostridium sp.]|nr:hypothetical protein [Clostridium sp.]
MNKIVVEVMVPAIGKTYDAKIPKDIQIWEVTTLLSEMIANIENGMYSSMNQAVLCDYGSGEAFPVNSLVDDTSIKNGTKVILV